MDSVVLQSVSKIFRQRAAIFNWLGKESTASTHALCDLNLKVAAGQVLALLGPNGSGKTTTLKLISTMLLPDAGQVMVQGFNTRTDPRRARRNVGFAVASERSFFPRLTARENLDFFATLDDIPRGERSCRIDRVLSQTGLANSPDVLVMKFSSGMYQRLGMARAVMKQPSVLLLDEPTRSLDPGSSAHFWNLVREIASNGTAVIVATHNFNEATTLGDAVAVLFRGRLAGYRELNARTTIDELRAFYFHLTEEKEEVPELAMETAV